VSEPFPPPFREVLRQILRRAPQLRAARDTEARARRRALAQTGTFAGHRAYVAGDDLRYVDWNAFARSGELFVKVLEEERRRALTLCVDRTASMASGEPQRLRGALRLAAILGGLALVRLDGVRLVTGAGAGEVHSFAGAAQLSPLLDALAAVQSGPQDPLGLMRAPLARGWQGMVVWISDFADPDAAAAPLRLLRRHGCRCTGWLPSLDSDREPRLDGCVRLIDPETGVEEVLEVDAALRRAMAEELELLARQQDAVFAAAGCPLVRIRLPTEGDFSLAAWFQLQWISRL
jgi:uncharacterized protein (DUF58 family)